MPCAPRTTVFFNVLLLLACPTAAFAWEPADGAEPGDSLNGPGFGIGAVIARLEWASLQDGSVVAPWIQDGLIMADVNVAAEKAMLGAILLARDPIGDPTILTVENIRQLPSGLVVYTLGRQVDSFADAMTWEPLCTDENGKSAEGMFLPGHWDQKTGNYFKDGITFACDGGALAKCTEAGYSAWDPDLRDFSLACVRMIRADYCGDGISHTKEGTPISFGDSYGIHFMRSEPEWMFEAIWTDAGASCLGTAPKPDGSGALAPLKRWVNLWNPGKCSIPFCSSDEFVAPSGIATLSSECRPNESQPTKCAPWYFVPSN
jgi:hypothetical protein